MDLDEPFAFAADPRGGGVVVSDEMALTAGGFAGAAIGKDSGVGREHTELMVAHLGADQGAGAQIRHDLFARLDRLFDVKEVRKEEGLEGGEVVVLEGLPQIELLDKEEVRLSAEGWAGRGLFGRALLSRGLLGGSENHREQGEDESWLHAGIVACAVPA
jgi:hypothetical protein